MHELLVPVGNMECLIQAINNGADAVYFAGRNFGARKFAKNFTNEEIVEAIHLCHLYGVKVFVTMNTLIKNDEVDSFIEQIRFLHKNGVDAVIVQDFGMICLIREMFPNLEIHASTQVNNSSKNTCELLYKLGVKRVVFSRELSVDEIDSIDIPIEKEAFIHGALCVSYSGCCLMSSMIGGRSGNRGECTGACRLPYSLVKNNNVINSGYLLSTKELNTSPNFKRLLDSSIYSFKIEGRMKSPLYVGFITSFYRKIIDGVDFNFEEETSKLKTIFNREFTLGHLFNKSNLEIMNSKSPNHVGLTIGTVCIKKNKICLLLNKGIVLHQYDAIRFLNSQKGMIINYLYDKDMKLCNSASGICYVDNKVDLLNDDILCLTSNYDLEKKYVYDHITKKIPINFNVIAKKNKKLKVTITDYKYTISLEGDIVSEANTAPIDIETIKDKLGKLGNTPFDACEYHIDIDDNIFIRIKDLNEIRRELVEKLINLREKSIIEFKENKVSFEKDNNNSIEKEYVCSVYNEEQLLCCLELNFKRIYVHSYELYLKYKNYDNIYYYLERCAFKYNNFNDKCLVSDLFDYSNYNDIYGSYNLNVENIYTGYYLKKYGLKNIPLSVELSQYEIDNYTEKYMNTFGNYRFEILCYGRVENMIIKGNVLDIDNLYNVYQLKDERDRLFPVFYDGIYTHILHYELVNNMFSHIDNVILRFDFYEETSSEIKSIMSVYRK